MLYKFNNMYYINALVIHLFFINFVYVIGAAPDIKVSPSSPSDCLGRVSFCESTGVKRRAICGSDGRTYSSRCALLRAQCDGEAVVMARRGPCIAENQSPCLIARRYALSAQSSRRTAFVPRCRSDGTYAAVQCSTPGAASGCWCVTPDGKPLPNTSVRNGQPDCTRTGKSHTRRRSSVRQRNKKSCTRTDRIQFNGNLIKIFSGEYERGRASGAADQRAVADWKFKELDRDGSGALQKSEYRGLRRLIKKVVKPKRCARAWARGCDADGDGEIARTEWETCLLSNPEPPAPEYDDSGADGDQDYDTEIQAPEPTPGKLPPVAIRPTFATEGSEMDSHREDEVNDCLTDRQAALDEQKSGSALYVPECTGDGRYARAQCYRSTGYCWCVHQDTGKPIPGSSVKDRRPDCESAPQHVSPMRGCPGPKKSSFLNDLKKFFITKMNSSNNGTAPGDMVKWGASEDEQAVTWTYVMLDKDKNKALERREWKAFFQLIANTEPLKRCGRKLPRYCDVNHDSRISLTEWMACLEVKQAIQGNTTEAVKPTMNPRRKGPNPLESILKAED